MSSSYLQENKELYFVARSALSQFSSETTNLFENQLKTHRFRLLNLFKHTPKSSVDRQKLTSASKDGVKFDVADKPIVFPQQYVDEALILSDLFDLNEIAALHLIAEAQTYTLDFPDIARGLLSVYLFYKSRWYLAETLKLLVSHCSGISWTINEQPEDLKLALSTFCENLWKDGLLKNLLDLICAYDLPADLEALQNPNVKGLGDAKHRKMVVDTITETYTSLSDVIFYWACQTPLTFDDFAALIRTVRKFDFTADDKSVPVDRVKASLIMSALQAVDVSSSENADSEENLLKVVPFVRDVTALRRYHLEISSDHLWKDKDVKSLMYLAWAISLRILSQNQFVQPVMEQFDDENEDDLFDRCFENRPFHWLRARLIGVENFLYIEEFFYRRIHTLLTQLIAYFPIKMKELRAMSEQECDFMKRYNAEELPNFHFEQFLLLLGDFYKNGASSSVVGLSRDYFSSYDSGYNLSTKSSHVQVSLFKFLRSTGESLHNFPPLYAAYLHTLEGLCQEEESACRCFAMLKEFGTYGIHLSSVSLDHFFSSLNDYYQAFRSGRSGSYQSSITFNPHIAPDELKAIQHWLRLVASIANHNPMSRIAFCEDTRWMCVANLYGLISCEVPLELKNLMFKFLAALGKSPEVSQLLIDGLIASNIVMLLPDGKLAGLKQELDEIESRCETYPVTRGLLELMISLITYGHLSNYREKSIGPYFDLIFNSVIVQMTNRSYKNQKEKWTLYELAAEFMFLLIKKFQVNLHNSIDSTPGATLMTMLLCDGPLFRTIVGILDNGVEILDRYVPFLGVENLHKTTLNLLKLISITLEKQELFKYFLQEANVPIHTSSMDVLLQTMNPKSAQPDYITKIMCYLSFCSTLPEHCYYAVKILIQLNAIFSVRTKLLNYLSLKQKMANRILNGFTSCLCLDEIDAPADFDGSVDTEDIPKERIRAFTAFAVLEFLSDSVRFDGNEKFVPTVGHFLLGFDAKNCENSVLQNPGINRTPKSCLHATLCIVHEYDGQNLTRLPYAGLIEPAYRLLYCVCSVRPTSEPTLRYLRNNHDFVYKQINGIDVDADDVSTKLIRQEIVGWLLKLTALELKSVATLNQRTNVNRLLTALFDVNSLTDGKDGTAKTVSVFETSYAQKPAKRYAFKLLSLLNFIQISDDFVSTPTLEYLNANKLSQIVSACTVFTTKRYPQCDVVRLHDILRTEALSLQGTTFSGRAQLFYEEIDQVLESVVQYNKLQYVSYVRSHAFDGCRQLLEIAFSLCKLDLFSTEQRIQIISVVLVHVLQTESSSLSRNVASAVLTLTTALRYQFIAPAAVTDSKVESSAFMTSSFSSTSQSKTSNQQQYVSVLDGTFVRESEMYGMDQLRHLNVVSTAFRLSLNFMTKSENKRSPVSRALMYGSLMNFFRLTSKASDQSDPYDSDAAVQYPSVRERMIDEYRRILSGHVIELVEMLCKDACDGTDVCRTLAIACLTSILAQDFCEQKVMHVLVTRGYVDYQISALLNEDDPKLSKLFVDKHSDIKPLYVYLSRVTFLMTVAANIDGSSVLLQMGVLTKLADCVCFSVLPDRILKDTSEDIVESLSARYRCAFSAALHLCLSIVDNSLAGNFDALEQTYRFLSTNQDVLTYFLRAVSSSSSSSSGAEELGRQNANLAKLIALTVVRCDVSAAGDSGSYAIRSDLEMRRTYFRKLVSNLDKNFIVSAEI